MLLFSLFIIACSSNSTEQFIRTWSGDINCTGDETPVDFLITLVAEDDSLLITIDDGDEPILIDANADGDNFTLETTTITEDEYVTEFDGTGSINSEGNLIVFLNVRFFEDGQLVVTGTCTAVLAQ